MVPAFLRKAAKDPHSPRIRGDGPFPRKNTLMLILFSPYSRGWSLPVHCPDTCEHILPVFAGMVPRCGVGDPAHGRILPVFAGMVPRRRSATPGKPYFPRIRGDGPTSCPTQPPTTVFSPYSRGWSQPATPVETPAEIFPVFAGMVPPQRRCSRPSSHFPRIRGDGPMRMPICRLLLAFSPYSRGWSHADADMQIVAHIFPVFAGMVPRASAQVGTAPNFPRIRGDDPSANSTE